MSDRAWHVFKEYSLPSNVVRRFRTAIRVYRESGFPGIHDAARVAIDTIAGNDRSYAAWIRIFDTPGASDVRRARRRLKAFKSKPLVSILMPVFNVEEDFLVAAIESVRGQIYPNWELCIADDASTLPHIRPTLERFQSCDPRIKVAFRERNGHISAASNTALEMARGEWIALLDHDDLLRPHSLFEMVELLNRVPHAKLVYSDEDKLSEEGQRCDPYFKPDWNYHLFLSHNLISHLGLYRADLVRKVGGFREGYEGSQDYDLALRVIEGCGEGEILHIPKVLYHWRKLPGSTSVSVDQKPYAMRAGERALNDHLRRIGKSATAHLIGAGYRVDYDLPAEPLVSILIPTRDRLDLMKKCVESIRQNTDYKNWELVIIDNNSVEQSTRRWLAEVAQDPRIRVARDAGDFNYSRLNNDAARSVSGDFILLLNNDVEAINAGWLSEMVSICVQPGIGAVGARLWYPDQTLQHGGVIVGLGGVASHAHLGMRFGEGGYFGRAVLRQELSAVTGACLLTRREAFAAVGGLDQQYLKVAYNDVDYCLKLRVLGWRIVWTPFADLYHHESASRESDFSPEQIERFVREQEVMRSRWSGWIGNDPAYNPNLSLTDSMFGLAFPPRATLTRFAAPNAREQNSFVNS